MPDPIKLTTADLPKHQTRAAINAFIRKLRVGTLDAVVNPARTRQFPDPGKMRQRVLVEMQSPLTTINEDHEISSRGLTDWYVGEYCRLNNLKKA